MNSKELFQILWKQYSTENPSVKAIHRLFEKEEEQIVNDHVAFRTFNHSLLNIDRLAVPFINAGYREAGQYFFPDKKLRARHFELDGQARVFISELLTEEFSDEFQKIIHEIIQGIDWTGLDQGLLPVSGQIFGTPEYSIYEKLRSESEYAAWVYAFGYRANHFTVSINHLKKYGSVELVNEFLKSNGYSLNSSGGEIKGSPGIFLEQSSTLADRIPVDFSEGTFQIPSCYYEFARRYPDQDGKLFGGFVAGSADKIFESTDFRR